MTKELDTLVERIRNEGITPYFAAKYYSEQLVKLGGEPIKTIGCTPREADVFFCACSFPYKHVKMWSPLTPKIFKRWEKTMANKAGMEEVIKEGEFYIFNYEIKPRVVRRELREMEETTKRFQEEESFDSKKLFDDFERRFPKPTLIFPYFRSRMSPIPQILTDKKLNSEIMNYLKREPQEIYDLIDKLWNDDCYTREGKKSSKSIKIFDLVNKPKELTFNIE